MTEIATRDHQADIDQLDRAISPTNGELQMTDEMQRLRDWAQTASAVNEIATSLVQSAFVPAAFRGKPVEATAAILAGIELGFSPMAALQAFDVIQGRAAPRAITIAAVLQSRGHEMRIVEWDDEHCVIVGRRKGETEWQQVEWNTQRADDLGLLGKDQWKKQKKTMLRWRATAELGRIIAADALLGIPYSAEELRDMDPVEGEVVVTTTTAAQAGKSLREVAKQRNTSRQKAAPKVAEAPDPADAEMMMQPDQADAIGKQMRQLGHTTPAAQLTFAGHALRRKVADVSELTAADAEAVLDALDAALAATQAEPQE